MIRLCGLAVYTGSIQAVRRLAFTAKRAKPTHVVGDSNRKTTPASRAPRVRHRRLRCDCGKLAVTVVVVQVGIDPQYTVHLPLCRECLALEQG